MGLSVVSRLCISHPMKPIGVDLARVRQRVGPPIIGGRKFNAATGLWINQGTFVSNKYVHTCTDEVGDKSNPHGLGIVKTQYQISPMNGTDPSNSAKYENWYPTGMSLLPSHLSTSQPSLGDLTNQLMARSNPGRATVSVPRAIAELRDLPHMVKQGGDIYARYIRRGATRNALRSARSAWRAMQDSAGLYLGYEFGIAPIASDISKLLHFQEHVARRVNELERLFSKGGLRRRLQLGNFSNSTSSVETIESGPGTYHARRMQTTVVTCWGTIRWKPSAGLNAPRTPQRMLAMARKAVLGFGRPGGAFQEGHVGMDAGDYWDIIPWSWMFNWFADVGTYLHANNNRIPSSPGRMCIMVHSKSKYEWTRTDRLEVSGGSGFSERESKERFVRTSASLPTGHIPFVSGWRLSIVSALAATRFR